MSFQNSQPVGPPKQKAVHPPSSQPTTQPNDQSQNALEAIQSKPVSTDSHNGSHNGNANGNDKVAHESTRQSWLQTTALTGAAATLVLPLVSEGANYSDTLANAIIPPAQAAANDTASNPEIAASAIAKSEGVLPNVSPHSATFSPTTAPLPVLAPPAEASQSQNQRQNQPQNQPTAAQATSANQAPVLTKGADGNWILTYQSTTAPQVQSVVSKLAQDATRTQQVCSGVSCRGLAYIDSQLPKVRQQLQSIQAQVKAFESTHAQQDITAYQKVLAGRVSEIAQQKTQLLVSVGETQRQIEGIKIQLSSANISDEAVGLAARSLSQDTIHQAAWIQLETAERSLTEEFSSANLDATALNEIYKDYEFHQQTLQRTAADALSNYLASPIATLPSFVQSMPEALPFVQQLTVITHQYKVQQLRLNSIQRIEQKLSDRQRRLVSDIGQYEQLQRQQASAQQLVNEYEQARNQIVTQQQSQPAEAQEVKAESETALARARKLAPQLPAGSTSQAVMFAVLAAGAIAAIVAHRRSVKRTLLPSWINADAIKESRRVARKEASSRAWPASVQGAIRGVIGNPAAEPTIDLSMLELESATPLADFTQAQWYDVEQSIAQTQSPFSDPTEQAEQADAQLASVVDPMFDLEALLGSKPEESEESLAAFEQRILRELLEITGQSVRVVEEIPALYGAESDLFPDGLDDDSLTIELLSRNLESILVQSTPEGSLAHEIRERAIAPVRLSLAEVDLFAEHAIRWILKDLGLSSLADELDISEAKDLLVGNAGSEAIKDRAFKLKQQMQALATVAP
jgi:hypothetical protein